jgi:tRNA-Thr(GGU) m(6)t(6)A37 methyltransferase TsaA
LKKIIYKPIGVIHSPYKCKKETPRQTIYSDGIKASVEIFPEFSKGLLGIERFSHIILLCHFNQSIDDVLTVIPPGEKELRGVFASRSPKRPNPIGLSVVQLLSVNGRILNIKDVDILDGTPILDIKPYIPEIDSKINNNL